MEKILSCMGLSKKYGELPALSDISINVFGGRTVGLFGAHGAGKTTFLRIAAGLLRPDQGEIEICGLPVSRGTKELAAYLPDKDVIPEDMTLSGAIGFYADFCTDFDKAAAISAMTDMRLDMTKTFGSFSAGFRQLISVLITMSRKTRLYLLDEPAAYVSPEVRKYIYGLISSLKEEGAAVVIASGLPEETEKNADDILMLQNGTVVYYGEKDGFAERFGCNAAEYLKEGSKCLYREN